MKKTQETFNNEASEYEQTSRKVNIYFDEALTVLVNNIKIRKQKIRILDVCCGTGILTNLVAQKYPKAQIVGVDFAKNMLDIAKHRLINFNFTPVELDVLDEDKMSNLSKDGQFDLIISSFGIHNIHTKRLKQQAISNIIKLLKDGGIFITCDIIKGNDKKECEHFKNFQFNWLLKSYTTEKATEWMQLLDEEDNPETIATNIKFLQNAGLKNIKLIWQKEFMAIWSGTK